ncbi:hypothetical protein COLO4_08486 [Corchorus olitorius]|uniref:Helitron helicase-like domain-containing protein n=1 Tax=Corchorus olitorius TaxID=93759 RepID=A0A1R3KFQ1_9ROSI|nr:hypothetical protein COLO4_08486 [Corchorus olitorius]
MGTLLPEEGRRPRYAQLYVVDTANECENCISRFVSDAGETIVRPDIVQGIQQMLDEIQHRDPKNNSLLHGGRLFQQFCVDAYSVVRDTRLRYLKKEQELFRVDGVQNVRDAVAQGDLRGDSVGQRIVLPASFTGSPRYMFQNYQDSLAICRHFGEAVANQNNVICGPEIDKIISAEIPDKVKDPGAFNAVANYMMHGPCGLAFPRASCMEEGRCKKRFPKAYQEFSTSDDDGFPLYRRRETDASVLINDIALDNRQKGNTIGRIIYIHPATGELYYLRLLVNVVKGATSYTVLRTVNGTVHQTFKEACHALGLLGDDKEWKMAIEEASVHAAAPQLRSLLS